MSLALIPLTFYAINAFMPFRFYLHSNQAQIQFLSMILLNKWQFSISTLANDRDQPPSAHDAQSKYDTADRRWVGWSNLLAFDAFDFNAVFSTTWIYLWKKQNEQNNLIKFNYFMPFLFLLKSQ